MSNPQIWVSPTNNFKFKNNANSIRIGDEFVLSAPNSPNQIDGRFVFNSDVNVVQVSVVKGIVPYGLIVDSNGIHGVYSINPDRNIIEPKDYTFTVRVIAKATPTQIANGTPLYFQEDRTFNAICGFWLSPDNGTINSIPYSQHQSVDIDMSVDNLGFNTSLIIEKIGGELPPGLVFSTAQRKITGVIGALPKGIVQYTSIYRVSAETPNGLIFQDRAFKLLVDPENKIHKWNSAWLNSLGGPIGNTDNNEPIYHLASIDRGAGINIPLLLENEDEDTLTFKVRGFAYPNAENIDPNSYEGLPDGLEVDQWGRISGTATIATNNAGNYYFKIYVREPSGNYGEATPNVIFRITVTANIVTNPLLSDSMEWGGGSNLGSTWETFPSHFQINAKLKFEDENSLANEEPRIIYSLSPSSRPLPPGIDLDSTNGKLRGICPHVRTDTKAQFTIQAQVVFYNKITGTIRYSDVATEKNFFFTIKNLMQDTLSMSVSINVPEVYRRTIADHMFGNINEYHDSHPLAPDFLTVVGRENLFRFEEKHWGRISSWKIPIVKNLKITNNGLQISPEEISRKMHENLKDYHHEMDLIIGSLKSAKGYDLEGNYVYDMIYFEIIDPLKKSGGFDDLNREVIMKPKYNPSTNNEWTRPDTDKDYAGVPEWNLPQNSNRYHPASITNARKDFINTVNRISWDSNNEHQRITFGLAGFEGLPFWMTCEQIPGKRNSVIGYIPAIELAYMKPGQGEITVQKLKQSGFEDKLKNKRIKVDRYVADSHTTNQLMFVDEYDGDPSIPQENIFVDPVTGVTMCKIVFDGPDSIPPTDFETVFDLEYNTSSKYYKFPSRFDN